MASRKRDVKETLWKTAGCCKACWFAKGVKCRCKCGGRNHQKGLVKIPETEDEFKKLAQIKPKNEDISEQLCAVLEKAIEQHPTWKQFLEGNKS